MISDLLADLSIEDIPSEHMQIIADRCGVSDAVSLMIKLPGLEIYVPGSVKKIIDTQYVKDNYNGRNALSIAVHLGVDSSKIKSLAKKDISFSDDNKFPNEHMQIIARECGEDCALRLMEYFPRVRFYIPFGGFRILIRRYIERNFNGTNTTSLALKCQVSERYVRKVIAESYSSRYQTSLFD